jgi:hypothetical protein
MPDGFGTQMSSASKAAPLSSRRRSAFGRSGRRGTVTARPTTATPRDLHRCSRCRACGWEAARPSCRSGKPRYFETNECECVGATVRRGPLLRPAPAPRRSEACPSDRPVGRRVDPARRPFAAPPPGYRDGPNGASRALRTSRGGSRTRGLRPPGPDKLAGAAPTARAAFSHIRPGAAGQLSIGAPVPETNPSPATPRRDAGLPRCGAAGVQN